MRVNYCSQLSFGCVPIEQLELNFDCRDSMIRILAALQQVHANPELRDSMCELIAQDVNRTSRADVGRKGYSYWQIFVLAVVRLGCDITYDKLQDLCENHLSLRCLLYQGEWDNTNGFEYRRLQATLQLLKPETLKELNAKIVGYGQSLAPTSAKTLRGDSFVTETNIHYPTESSLMWDGVRKILDIAVRLSAQIGASGWRQTKHHRRSMKKLVRTISFISGSRNAKVKEGLNAAYRNLIQRVGHILHQARSLADQAIPSSSVILLTQLKTWIKLTTQVCDTAFRRTQLGEAVPNDEKLFSLFETHTQLYQRGKAGTPIQYGRLILIFEDGIGFISHYKLLDRNATDSSVAVEEVREAQRLHDGQAESISLDRGFYTKENLEEIEGVVSNVCIPPRNPREYKEYLENRTPRQEAMHKRHSGVEAAIGCLQSSNGLKRCRDHSEEGLDRYLGLAVLGRNMLVLGKLVIAAASPDCAAAKTFRQAA